MRRYCLYFRRAGQKEWLEGHRFWTLKGAAFAWFRLQSVLANHTVAFGRVDRPPAPEEHW